MQKNVLITGASGNLGQIVVQHFLNEGYRVLITVTPGKTSDFEENEDLFSYQADLADEASAARAVDAMVLEHKTIDAALLLVGGFASGGINEADGDAIHKMISLNFDTAYFVARPVFRHMMSNGIEGRIFLVGSRPSLYPGDGKDYLAYALSKSMLFKFAEFLNAEGNPHNIVTSVVVPGTIDTPANRKAMPKADFSKWVAPEEIARTMAFFCREENQALREPVLKFFGRN